MFTGIVEELATVRSVDARSDGARIVIESPTIAEDLAIGGSVAVNGCCLTAVEIGAGWFAADVVAETLGRTSLGRLEPGDAVNLERPMAATGRLDGHLVQGHVDATGVISRKAPGPDGSFELDVSAPAAVTRYLVEKGSVAVDGVSLTVAAVTREGFRVAVIPHTAQVTTLGSKGEGDPVNLEVDVIAKYVERLVAPFEQSP
ncbi:MAG TPA: riboflavin synthase [Acidimicrobiia bacterium]|nr:riboflavin synthase [Acidimicrobiia bacterium]